MCRQEDKHTTCKRQKWLYWGIGLVVLLGCLCPPAFLQAQELPEVASTSLSLDVSEVNTLWFRIVNYLNNGNLEEADLTLKDLNRKKLELGLENMSLRAQVLVKKAFDMKKQGNLQGAIKLVESAKWLSPDTPEVYFALAKLSFSQNMTDIYNVTHYSLRGLLLKYADVMFLFARVNTLVFVLVVTGIVTSAVFIVFSFLYYRRAIFYWLKEFLPGDFPLLMGNLIGWAVIAVVTLGVGFYWGLLCLALLLLWHVESASRVILQVILFLAILVGPLLIGVGMTYSIYGDEYMRILRDISRGEFSSQSAAMLQTHLKESASYDPYAVFGLAYIAQKVEKDDVALQAYQMIPRQYPDWVVVQNNMGNIYRKRYEQTKEDTWYQEAEEAYRNASRNAPDMFEPHYNLGQLLLLQFTESDAANTEIQKATEINEERFNFYSDNRIVRVNASFSTMALLKRVFMQDIAEDGTAVAKRLWQSGSRFANPWYFSLASILVFVLSFVAGTSKKKRVMYCQMCGDPYTFIQRKRAKEPQTFCTQCTHIFKKKTVVKPEKRAAKVKQIQLRQKTRGFLAKISSLVFPGSGQVYFGYPLKGLLLAFFFYLALVTGTLKGYFRVLLEAEGTRLFSLTTLVILGILIVGAYLFNLRDIFRLSPKNQ